MIISYGFDRLKLSVSNYVFSDNDFLLKLEPRGMSKGFRWFSNAMFAVGVSHGFCVVEFFALWFMTKVNSMSEVEEKVNDFLQEHFIHFENPRMSRVDVYVDYTADYVEQLQTSDYTGKSLVKTGSFSGENGTETTYLFTKSKVNKRSWTLRRYDKSLEIQDNMTAHRYDTEYSSGVIRIEAEYQKEFLKNLKERTFKNSMAYIVKHLKACTIDELKFLAERIDEECSGGVVQYKAKTAGQHTGKRTKERIYKALSILHEDFIAICGDDRELFAELAKIAKKELSIHV